MRVFGATDRLAIISVGNPPLSAGLRPSIQFVRSLGSFAPKLDGIEQMFESADRLAAWQINRKAHRGEALVECRSLSPSCQVLSHLFT